MKKYFLLSAFLLSLSTSLFGQEEELPLVGREIYDYLEIDGIQVKKATQQDFTSDEVVEIIVWITQTNQNGLLRKKDFGIVDGDTLIKISIEQFDSFGNLILKIDSSNNRLVSHTQFEYSSNRLIKENRLGYDWFWTMDSTFLPPTTSITSYIYEGDRLIKRIKAEEGGFYSKNGESTYSETYEYNLNDQIIREIYLSESDTLSITVNTYDSYGNLIRAESPDSTSISTWRYDEKGKLIESFIHHENLISRDLYYYDSLGRLVKREIYLKQ